MKVDLMKESIHMFNWENLWSDIKKKIFIIIVTIIIIACLIGFFPQVIQAFIDALLPYFEK